MQFSSSKPTSALALLLGLAGIVTAWHAPSSFRPARVAGTNLRMSSPSSSSPRDGSTSKLSHSSSLSPNPPSQPAPSSMVPSVPLRRSNQLYKDVVIVGGGLAGLSTALYLTQIDPERRITVLDKNEDDGNIPGAGNMASMAAAGMLAPNSERLPKGDYRDLCMASRRMYADFTSLVEGMAQESGPEGLPYLTQDDGSGLDPWNIGYVASGGFFAPAFAGDSVATWAPPEEEDGGRKTKASSAVWLDATQARELEPHLHPDVVGGWWFPEDASVDARRLTCSLKAACVGAGVEFLCGPRNEVTSLDLQDGRCNGFWLGSESGRYVSAKAVLVANGAWMRNLLPVPLEPHKGQSLSLRMPKDRPPILKRVLFGGDSYIVPKADGRIVIGATVEAGSFDSAVTPAGIMHVLSYALELVPGLADLPIEETWAGLRPTTPDKGPILGETPWENLYLAGGYWRNGVLLAPKTGHLLATLIASQNKGEGNTLLSRDDEAMLEAFAWDRFTSPEGGKRMAANARYAASMYPVHKRKSGTGVAAAVGTELGSYSTARSAGEERQKDRKSLFGSDGFDGIDSETEDLFEKAAMMGREDAEVFEGLDGESSSSSSESTSDHTGGSPSSSGGDGDDKSLKFYYSEQETALGELRVLDSDESSPAAPSPEEIETTVPYDGSADAITVGSADNDAPEGDEDAGDDASRLELLYESIRENKAKQKVDLPDQDIKDTRPDPGFRISHVCKKTGKVREMPPYVQPGEFFESLEQQEQKEEAEVETPPSNGIPTDEVEGSGSAPSSGSGENYDETTYDGYQEIFKANASSSRKEELEKMKLARISNRSSAPPREVRKKE
ncbi:unnamed protein product [Pseudo-nitzschia multistriata]|uniref:FAD dependent oxidoreductase domain-containing protein n=1 Tax=Pseudo-nitzschia multistriata TaxID=183589 RepID=A0A448ZQW4_9STRA|nr:unnamed protein product [Pseudo-nitzschia multistriata]